MRRTLGESCTTRETGLTEGGTRLGRKIAAAVLVAACAGWLAPAATAEALDLKLGGYAKIDLVYSNKIAGGGTKTEFAGGAAAVPLNNDKPAQNNDFNVEARQSRLNLTATGDVDGIKIKNFVEIDFWANAEGNRLTTSSWAPRWRHFYGQATTPSGFTVLGGQTWSNFVDIEIFWPDLVDFNGPAGQVFARQPQLRVGQKIGDVTATVSAESGSLKLPATGPSAGVSFAQSQELPLMTGKVVWAPGFLTTEAAGAWTRDRAIFADGTKSSATAWGAQFGLGVPIGPVTLKGNIHRTTGLGRLLNGDFNDGEVVTGNELVLNKILGGYAGATVQALPNTKLTALYGWQEVFTLDPRADRAQDAKQQSIHANVLQKFWGNVQAGLEYQYLKRTRFDGEHGNMARVQGALWYYF
jgi:hypothetical protein